MFMIKDEVEFSIPIECDCDIRVSICNALCLRRCKVHNVRISFLSPCDDTPTTAT